MADNKAEGGNSNEAVTYILVLLILMGLGWFLWWKFHAEIVAAARPVRLAQLWLISLVTSALVPLADWVRYTDPAEVTFEQFKYLAEEVGRYTRWLLIPAAAGLVFTLYRTNVFEHNRKRESIDSLMRSQAGIWPQIKCVVGLNIQKRDPRKGPWASAMTEYEFAVHHRLLGPAGDLDRDRAAEVFAAQLGPRWQGPERLDNLTRAVFALYAGRVASEAEEDTKMKEEIYALTLKLADEVTPDFDLPFWKRWAKKRKGPDLSWVDPLVKKSMADSRVRSLIDRHAYVYTAIASLVERSHASGVMPSCDFLWIKPRNRRLFYVLNAVDRRSHFAEVAGVMGHWLAEKKAGQPLHDPYVAKAVDAFEEALGWFVYEGPTT